MYLLPEVSIVRVTYPQVGGVGGGGGASFLSHVFVDFYIPDRPRRHRISCRVFYLPDSHRQFLPGFGASLVTRRIHTTHARARALASYIYYSNCMGITRRIYKIVVEKTDRYGERVRREDNSAGTRNNKRRKQRSSNAYGLTRWRIRCVIQLVVRYAARRRS